MRDESTSSAETGKEIHAFLERLFPLCRSITGAGVRATLEMVREHIPLEMHEVPSGTKAFDWTVPKEWNISDAYILTPDGRKIADFKKNNLHVVSYSTPIRAKLSLAELVPHLHSIPEKPEIIPYRTSYYEENWGFCLADAELTSLTEGTYEVVIDSTLKDGSLTYGELFIPGESAQEVLLSCYTCHPSMGNDSISGVALLTFLAKRMLGNKHRYSYRFLFIPETIGAIVWLSRNAEAAARIKFGLVATCVGDDGAFTYKKSRRGNAGIDRIVAEVLAKSGAAHEIMDFFPWGSDERQYCSPGFDLPVGSLMRTLYYRYPHYHSSADTLDVVTGENIAGTLAQYEAVIERIEAERFYKNLFPQGEPQLGRRGLYGSIGGPERREVEQHARAWVLSLSDGAHSLADIATRSRIDIVTLEEAARALAEKGVVEEER